MAVTFVGPRVAVRGGRDNNPASLSGVPERAPVRLSFNGFRPALNLNRKGHGRICVVEVSRAAIV